MNIRISSVSQVNNFRNYMKAMPKIVKEPQTTNKANLIFVSGTMALLTGADFLNKTGDTKIQAAKKWVPPMDSSDYPHYIEEPAEPQPYIYGSGEPPEEN